METVNSYHLRELLRRRREYERGWNDARIGREWNTNGLTEEGVLIYNFGYRESSD